MSGATSFNIMAGRARSGVKWSGYEALLLFFLHFAICLLTRSAFVLSIPNESTLSEMPLMKEL